MHQESDLSTSGPDTYQTGCVFCERAYLSSYILKESSLFRVVADHAPLVEGHLLIIPKNHYTCYGDMPAIYDEELDLLKDEARRFFARYYQPIVYWEHGVFHQSVFHAHLHCFPFGDVHYDPTQQLHAYLITRQDEIRTWHARYGHYFYLEDSHNAALFAPKDDTYLRIVQGILWPGVLANSPHPHWRSAQQRQAEGAAHIAALHSRWQQFQQEEQHANTTSKR